MEKWLQRTSQRSGPMMTAMVAERLGHRERLGRVCACACACVLARVRQWWCRCARQGTVVVGWLRDWASQSHDAELNRDSDHVQTLTLAGTCHA